MRTLLLLLVFIVPLRGQLRIDPGGFKMSEGAIRTLFEAVIGIFPEPAAKKDPPIFLSRNPKGPIVLYERTPRGEIAMQLDTGEYYYAQMIYQFSHELAHIRADFQPIDHENKWLEETLCETASLFALRQLAIRWADKAPNKALQGYRKHLTNYAERVMKTREPLTPKTSPEFYRKHRKSLRESPTKRTLNGSFANLILPLLEKDPGHWQTLSYFPRRKGASLAEHFEMWRKACPAKHRPFLEDLESLFLP